MRMYIHTIIILTKYRTATCFGCAGSIPVLEFLQGQQRVLNKKQIARLEMSSATDGF